MDKFYMMGKLDSIIGRVSAEWLILVMESRKQAEKYRKGYAEHGGHKPEQSKFTCPRFHRRKL